MLNAPSHPASQLSPRKRAPDRKLRGAMAKECSTLKKSSFNPAFSKEIRGLLERDMATELVDFAREVQAHPAFAVELERSEQRLSSACERISNATTIKLDEWAWRSWAKRDKEIKPLLKRVVDFGIYT